MGTGRRQDLWRKYHRCCQDVPWLEFDLPIVCQFYSQIVCKDANKASASKSMPRPTLSAASAASPAPPWHGAQLWISYDLGLLSDILPDLNQQTKKPSKAISPNNYGKEHNMTRTLAQWHLWCPGLHIAAFQSSQCSTVLVYDPGHLEEKSKRQKRKTHQSREIPQHRFRH